MNQEPTSFSPAKITTPVRVNFDDFNLSEDSFKPMTKGLGFHQEQKRSAFKSAPKEVKPFGAAPRAQNKASAILNTLTTKVNVTQHIPTGLEAFYGATGTSQLNIENTSSELKIQIGEEKLESLKSAKIAGMGIQFFAFMIDAFVILSFVAVTGALLVLASGIELKVLMRLISLQDIAAFAAAIFSIYYLLYFTILDLSASPGKTIFGLRLLKLDNKNVSVKNTFTRALVSLLSSVALFMPLILDFQGRLSDTKVVK